jgi:hypothetical protein
MMSAEHVVELVAELKPHTIPGDVKAPKANARIKVYAGASDGHCLSGLASTFVFTLYNHFPAFA